MDNYDLTRPDYYSARLAEVNATHTVSAAQDIYNSKGILLIRKGHRIQPEVAHKLLNHKLVKPLEAQVSLEGCIDGRQLQTDLLGVLTESAELRAIHRTLNLAEDLDLLTGYYNRFELLTQKITVLKLRLPDEYEKALFCAWYCLAMANSLGCNEAQKQAAFLAGLCHDVGMLHLDPAILYKKGQYDADEWRAMQSHTLIATAFLSYIPSLPKMTLRAVREHHERLDGTGYPQGLFEDQLSIIGQLVAMSDVVFAIRRRGLKNLGRPLNRGEILPILQVNSLLFPPSVYSAAVSVLRRAPLEQDTHAINKARAVPELRKNLYQLKDCVESVLALNTHFLDGTPLPRFKIACIMIKNMHMIVASSGLLSDPILRWLDHVHQQDIQAVPPELAEMDLMAQELNWQLRQLLRVVQLAAQDAETSQLPSASILSEAVRESEQLFARP